MSEPTNDKKSIPLRCRLGWHRWPKWSDPFVATILLRVPLDMTPSSSTEQRVIQERICPDCRRYDWRDA